MVEKGGDVVIPWHRSAAPGVSDGSYPDTYPESPAVASAQPKVGTREAQQVIEQGGDYALALEGNQGTLRDDVRLFLDDPETPLA